MITSDQSNLTKGRLTSRWENPNISGWPVNSVLENPNVIPLKVPFT